MVIVCRLHVMLMKMNIWSPISSSQYQRLSFIHHRRCVIIAQPPLIYTLESLRVSYFFLVISVFYNDFTTYISSVGLEDE